MLSARLASKIASKKLAGTSWLWAVLDGHACRESPARWHNLVLDGHAFADS